MPTTDQTTPTTDQEMPTTDQTSLNVLNDFEQHIKSNVN
jgi:hypothetical protein